MLKSLLTAVEDAEQTPQKRLGAFIDVSFSPMLFDRDVLGVWVVFWGLVLHSPRMSAAQQGEYSGYVAAVEALLGDLAVDEGFKISDIRLTAIAFTALLDGLWLASCLNPDSFEPHEGTQLCRNWMEGLRRGAHG